MSLPQPVSHLIITNDKGRTEVEVFRCETDGAVMFRSKNYDSSLLYRLHGGHKLRQPTVLSEEEIEGILEELRIV